MAYAIDSGAAGSVTKKKGLLTPQQKLDELVRYGQAQTGLQTPAQKVNNMAQHNQVMSGTTAPTTKPVSTPTPNPVSTPTPVKTSTPTPAKQITATATIPSGTTAPTTSRDQKSEITTTQSTGSGTITGTPMIQTAESVEPQTDYQDLIQQMIDAQRESKIAALQKARDNALANLTNEEAGITPQYYDKRNQAAAQSDVGALNFAQYMAGRGIKGGAGAMPEIYRNSALQGNIGNLNQQEQAARDTIARNRTGVNNAYESDVVAANADIDAQGLQAYINQMNADRAFGLQEAGVTGTYNGTPTLANQQFQADTQYRNKTFDENVRQFEANYGLKLEEMKQADVQQAIDNAYRNNQLTLQQAQQALDESKFIYQQGQDELDRKDATNEQLAAETAAKTNTFNSYLEEGNKMLMENSYDSAMRKNVPKYTPEQIRQWIYRLPLSDSEAEQLEKALGVSL